MMPLSHPTTTKQPAIVAQLTNTKRTQQGNLQLVAQLDFSSMSARRQQRNMNMKYEICSWVEDLSLFV